MTAPKPPTAPKIPHRTEQLGRTRVDDYAWMKDDNWQQVLRDPKVLRADVRDHLNAENAYTKAMLASTEPLKAQLFAEMKGRIKEDDSSVPAPDGPWDYYVRYDLGAQHPIHARRPKGQAPTDKNGGEQVLLDEEALSKGKAFFQVGAAHHSPDHSLYAWAADEQGSEYYTIRMKDLASGEELGQAVESAYGDFAFSPDSQWIFWIWRDENARPSKVFRRPARPGPDWGGGTCWSTRRPTRACSWASGPRPTTATS
jgi:oligopeptidase B